MRDWGRDDSVGAVMSMPRDVWAFSARAVVGADDGGAGRIGVGLGCSGCGCGCGCG
jgi:hypothetical protein